MTACMTHLPTRSCPFFHCASGNQSRHSACAVHAIFAADGIIRGSRVTRYELIDIVDVEDGGVVGEGRGQKGQMDNNAVAADVDAAIWAGVGTVDDGDGDGDAGIDAAGAEAEAGSSVVPFMLMR